LRHSRRQLPSDEWPWPSWGRHTFASGCPAGELLAALGHFSMASAPPACSASPTAPETARRSMSDYAHQARQTGRPCSPAHALSCRRNALFVVFGCGGGPRMPAKPDRSEGAHPLIAWAGVGSFVYTGRQPRRPASRGNHPRAAILGRLSRRAGRVRAIGRAAIFGFIFRHPAGAFAKAATFRADFAGQGH